MPISWLVLASVLGIASLVVLWVSRRWRLTTGLPVGRVVYSDAGAWQHCDQALFSARLGLAGKPDYIVRENGQLIPVEVKPGRDASQPYRSDVLQLAAYCLLIEEKTSTLPGYGYLRYRHETFRLAWSDELRAQVLTQLAQMREDLDARDVLPNHAEVRRCRNCGHRDRCQRRIG